MNRKSHGLSISKAIPGFIQYKAAEALSPTTLRSYADDLKKWLDRTGDKEVNKVTTEDLRAFFVWLRTEYKPRRFDGCPGYLIHPPPFLGQGGAVHRQ
jgi:integrase/recombinase XerD